MPTKAPSYFHWAQDKPCTTNQVYGYELKDGMEHVPPRHTPGPFDYTRPFSNTAFFPQIASKNSSHVIATRSRPFQTCKSAVVKKSAIPEGELCPLSPARTKFNINRGYTTGYMPVKDRLIRSSLPIGQKMDRSKSAPQRGCQYKKPKASELYLWHTLSGSLVHVENYPAEKRV